MSGMYSDHDGKTEQVCGDELRWNRGIVESYAFIATDMSIWSNEPHISARSVAQRH